MLLSDSVLLYTEASLEGSNTDFSEVEREVRIKRTRHDVVFLLSTDAVGTFHYGCTSSVYGGDDGLAQDALSTETFNNGSNVGAIYERGVVGNEDLRALFPSSTYALPKHSMAICWLFQRPIVLLNT